MSDQESVFRAILRDPEDDTVRLAYADVLSELGQSARAEFIRVQVELAKTPMFEDQYESCRACGGDGMSDPPPYHRTCRACRGTGKKDHEAYERVKELLNRESALWQSYASEWFSANARVLPNSAAALVDVTGTVDVGSLVGNLKGDVLCVRRGFADEVRSESWKLFSNMCGACSEDPTRTACTYCGNETGDATGLTNGYAARLFDAHPISRVRLTDKEPGDVSGNWCWERRRPYIYDNEDEVHIEVHILVHRLWNAARETQKHVTAKSGPVWLYYDSEDDAKAALSAGAVKLGRELVGLDEKG